MNIFVVHQHPIIAAKQLCNAHVVKLALESTQLLSTAVWLNGGIGPYRISHAKHPCAIWAAKTSGNYAWLIRHAQALTSEYTYRYGRVHACESVIRKLRAGLFRIPIGRRTEHPQCMPDPYKVNGDPVAAYRAYYHGEKAYFAIWTRRSPPFWWK